MARLREAIDARNEDGVATAWRTVLVAGDVPPASAYSDPKCTDRSEGYVDDVCAAVGAVGAVDAILCAGRCDDAVARALARRRGGRAVIPNPGGVGPLGGRVVTRGAVRDLRECTSGSAVEMCLDASAWGVGPGRAALSFASSVTYLSAYLETPTRQRLYHPVREVEARVPEMARPSRPSDARGRRTRGSGRRRRGARRGGVAGG